MEDFVLRIFAFSWLGISSSPSSKPPGGSSLSAFFHHCQSFGATSSIPLCMEPHLSRLLHHHLLFSCAAVPIGKEVGSVNEKKCRGKMK